MSEIDEASDGGARPMPALRRWVLGARPKTLSLSQVPVLAGTWLAAEAGDWRLDATVVAMIATGCIQIGTNLWNDAADAARGVDMPDRLGPPRVTALGLLDGAAVRRAALGAFGVAMLAGGYLAWLGGWPIVLIGLVALVLGYAYSSGPWPLSGLPVGELLVIAFFGVVAVSGTVWLHGGDPLAGQVLALGLVVGFPAAAVLMLNNHRDRVQDARAGRRTLAILAGPTASRALYVGALGAGLALGIGLAPSQWMFAPVLFAAWLSLDIWRLPISAELNRLIARTGLFQIVLVLAVALG